MVRDVLRNPATALSDIHTTDDTTASHWRHDGHRLTRERTVFRAGY